MSTVKVGSGNDIAIMCRLGRGRSNPPWPNVRQLGDRPVPHLHAVRVQSDVKTNSARDCFRALSFFRPSGRQAVRPSATVSDSPDSSVEYRPDYRREPVNRTPGQATDSLWQP